MDLADHGLLAAGAQSNAIRHGLNTYEGKVAHPAVAEALRLRPQSPWD
jgi:alanine dehydrogenase